jgi:bifunctional DNase/RNase
MIEVVIDSIRISLVSQHRIVLLRDVDSERRLPIWIGPCEADAITIELQDVKVARPLTQDLLRNIISELGGQVSHVLIKELNESVFHARLFINLEGEQEPREIDCRPSDAIALAVRAKVPIFIAEEVMEAAAVEPEPDMQEMEEFDGDDGEEVGNLDAFSDFLDTLDFDDFDEGNK